MMEILWTHLQSLLDLSVDPADPDAGAVALRTVIVYAFTLGSARL